ncbi:SAM-dependent methyltransferase [Marimonas arenosa]|uniref:Class I SAM-dependent methyltransferase n=1 Tax=Marimonas arenosa TaxID=1795305 RepID=A0AAE3W949_9RHOB|nr:class I SAM-dependent methyltransferase [Marimonas arenosa]MDQ2088379.1 class I SAM-dependent methyltransferase [Marimonas arenosa]
MWEERFAATSDYVFGKEPARFLVDHEAWLKPGLTVLSVADGEGRNSVYLAEKGLQVTALEFAPSALRKARALATDRGVTVDFRQFDVMAQEFPGEYDIVAGLFIQFVGPVDRNKLFAKMQKVTKPGGIVMLHGYTPEQVVHGTGGPPHVANMYTEKTLRESFPGWEILEVSEYEREAQSGKGIAAYIDFIARKPA